jgi:AcrR family transcriptional regulator
VTQKVRRRDATLNDARIYDATIAQLARVGPDKLAVKTLVTAAGLTTGPFYSRYLTIGELLADVWRQRLAAVARELIEHVVQHRRRGTPDHAAAVAMMSEPPSPQLTAALTLMIVAPRVDELAEVVPTDVDGWLGELGLTGPGSPPERSVELGLACFAFGAALRRSIPADTSLPFCEVAALIPATVDVPDSPVPLPTGDQVELVVASDDPLRASLVLAAQQVAARSGVVRATLTRIGRVANLPSTAVYGRYESKVALFEELCALALSTLLTPRRQAAVHASAADLSAGASGWLCADAHMRRRLEVEMLLGAMFDEELQAAYCTLQQAHLAAAIPALLPAHDRAERAEFLVRFTVCSATGLALLSGVAPAISQVDWRPMVHGLFAGLDACFPLPAA